MTIQTKTATQEFLSKISPFDRLPEMARVKLSEQVQVRSYSMGDAILLRDPRSASEGNRIPQDVSILYQGQARLIGCDPRTGKEITLEILQPGAIIGWTSIMRGVGGETVLAREDCLCLALPVSEFWQLLQQHSFLQEWQNRCTAMEAFELLGGQLEKQALGAIDLKELAIQAVAQAEIRYLQPGKISLDQLDYDRIWFFSGGGTIKDLPVGSLLYANLPYLEVKSQPVRLVGLPIVEFKFLVLGSWKSEQSLSQEPDSLAPAIQSESLLHQPSLPQEQTQAGAKKLNVHYPHVKGKGDLDAALACFEMVGKHLEIPFRRSVIRRILNDQQQRSGSLSLSHCSAVAELMSLNNQLVQVPANAISRLPIPALISWQDSFAIVYEASASRMVLGVPEKGIRKYKPAQFLDIWGQGGQALLLQKSNITPQQKFGLSWFVPSLIRYRRTLLEVLLASFFVQLFGLANPLIVQRIIDLVITQKSLDALHVFGVFLLVVAVFEAILSSLRTYLFSDTTNRIDLSLGSEIIDRLMRLPLRYFEKRPVGELASRINELENIRSFLTGTALTVILDAVFSIVYLLVMWLYSWQLTLVILGTIPVFIGVTMLFAPIARQQLRAKAEQNSQAQTYLMEVLSGIQTVKAQNIESRSRKQWQKRYARYVKAGFKTVMTSTLAGSIGNFLNKFSQLLVLWIGAYLAIDGQLTLGELIAFRIIAGYVTSPMMRIAQTWQKFQETALSLERLSDIMDTPQEQDESQQNNIPMPAVSGAITYENITFSFKTGTAPQLDRVNLTIPAGQFVAIVGQSGSGKSTLTKLLVRLYEPQQGRILLDDYDISKVELYSLRRQIGVVPQDPLLFDGTIEENIALTYPDATTEEIIQAAQIADAHEFIMNLPNGYNTRVGERGSALSGGQRQRIAIARTVLQQPRLLILDEATSALDAITEQRVCKNLAQAFQNRTVLFITHRLNTIKHADSILMMNAGSVAEMGTHDKLMALRGRYFCLYQQQDAQG